MTKILQIGNFGPEHSTENHIKRALINNGHGVTTMQEDLPLTFDRLAHDPNALDGADDFDFILWTRTGWDWNRIYPGGEKQALLDQRAFLRRARMRGVPVVGYHLDIWFGLKREYQLGTEPFFDVDLLVTADGGHPDRWIECGINHLWLPPGISKDEAKVGRLKTEYAAEIVFVGSWQGGYHPESEHRYALVEFLKHEYANRCMFWPQPGQHAVRGKPLQDLYRSTKVVVGDSCFAGTGLANYWSDRIPETLGRGGLLLHPDVPGLEDYFTDGLDLLTWPAFDFDALGAQIERALSDDKLNSEIRRHGRKMALEYHTYEFRMKQLIDTMTERGML